MNRRKAKSSQGFTLVEVLVSFILMAIGMIAIWGLHVSSLRVDFKNQRESKALGALTQRIENIRAAAADNKTAYADLSDRADYDFDYDNVTYTCTDNVTARTSNIKDVVITCEWSERARDASGEIHTVTRRVRMSTCLLNPAVGL